MLKISDSIQIPAHELQERFVRASGPGGQNVNKVASAVELRFDVAQSQSLPEAVRARLLARADRRLTDEGVLVIQASRLRDQSANREDARQRLVAIIQSVLRPPRARIATRPTRGSRERRLRAKTLRGRIKKERGRRDWSDH